MKNKGEIIVCAFIHHNFDGLEKLFVAKRADGKKFLPGVFELPGGHVELGENPVDGLKREIFEEFGMKITVGDEFYNFSYGDEQGSHSTETIYFAEFESPIENIRLNPQDHSEFLWISKEEISRITSVAKPETNEEIKAIKKGFELLRDSRINTL